MNGPQAVTATFTKNPVLTVSKGGAGGGTVTSDPGGIDCGSDCQEPYEDGTTVTLTAAPDPGSTFGGWSGGGACGMALLCQVTMNGDRSVTATFDVQATHTLNFSATGDGTVDVSPSGTSCGTGCAGYAENTSVTVTATLGSTATIVTWGGDCTGQSGNTCTLTMDGDKTATATFA